RIGIWIHVTHRVDVALAEVGARVAVLAGRIARYADELAVERFAEQTIGADASRRTTGALAIGRRAAFGQTAASPDVGHATASGRAVRVDLARRRRKCDAIAGRRPNRLVVTIQAEAIFGAGSAVAIRVDFACAAGRAG